MMVSIIHVITCALLATIARARTFAISVPPKPTSSPTPSPTRSPTKSTTRTPTTNPTIYLSPSQYCEGQAVAAFAASMPFLTKPNGKKELICWMAITSHRQRQRQWPPRDWSIGLFGYLIFIPRSQISSWFFLFSGSQFSEFHSLDWDSQYW